MRDIKFRGKRLDNDEWVYGYLVKHLPYTPSAIISKEELKQVESDYEYYIVKDGFSDWNMPRNTENIRVDPESVGQYTGLRDSEGKEIYEGDIIQFSFWWFDGSEREDLLIGTIVYSDDLMSYQLKGVKNREWEKHTGYENDTEYLTPFSELNFEDADFSVIGNTIDNKDLLK